MELYSSDGEEIMKIARIVFCVLACLCVAAVIPAGFFIDFYCLFFVAGAVVFGVLMALCKRADEPKPAPKPDFMNSDEENEAIRNENEKKD